MADNVLKIGTLELAPYLKEYSVDISDLDAETSGRNAKGEMLRDRIAVKRKINVSLIPLDDAGISRVLSAIKGIYFDVTYHEPEMGGMKTGKFYVGDRKMPALGKRVINGAEKWLWNGASFSLIEK